MKQCLGSAVVLQAPKASVEICWETRPWAVGWAWYDLEPCLASIKWLCVNIHHQLCRDNTQLMKEVPRIQDFHPKPNEAWLLLLTPSLLYAALLTMIQLSFLELNCLAAKWMHCRNHRGYHCCWFPAYVHWIGNILWTWLVGGIKRY